MSPARIDLKVVGDRLGYAEECLAGLRGLPLGSQKEFLADRRNAWSADSLLRRGIEAIFDTARHILAKRFGVGELEYRAIARDAVGRGLITDPELGRRLDQIAGYRNRLVHHYEDVTPQELYEILSHDLDDLARAIHELRDAAARLADEGP